MKRLSNARLVKISVVAAIYVVLTVAIEPLSYGAIQFRFSEILMLMCFYKFDYCISLTLGCAIANIFSPFAIIDVPFGTLATLISTILIYRSNKLWLASFFPTIFNGIIVGLELNLFYDLPILISILSVAIGEFIVVTFLGMPIFLALQKNKLFMNMIGADSRNF
ncbi:MAG: QueT transporter family protein [Clostridiales bacterium]|nr:QueT transporter family protein [Clostridiales bacterium]